MTVSKKWRLLIKGDYDEVTSQIHNLVKKKKFKLSEDKDEGVEELSDGQISVVACFSGDITEAKVREMLAAHGDFFRSFVVLYMSTTISGEKIIDPSIENAWRLPSDI
jgi:hypothetical protein